MISVSWLSLAPLSVAFLSVQMSLTFEKGHLSCSRTAFSVYLAQIIKPPKPTANTAEVCLCLIHTGMKVAVYSFV
jgi:hypothetical protein